MKKYNWFLIVSAFLMFYSCQPDTPQKEKESVVDSQPKEREGGEQAFSPQDPFVQKYQGDIGGKYPIEMLLTHWGDGFLTGYFFYTKTNKRIELQGEMNINETVELQAYLDEEAIDQFVFPFTSLDKIVGEWSSPEKDEALPFSLIASSKSTDDSWSGSWYLNGIWDGGQLMIGDVRDTAFYFALSIVRNSHIGEVEGEAKIMGDSAVFKNNLEFGMGEDSEPCVLHFYHHDDHIEVKQRSTTLACGFGMRAYASGQYDNKVQEIKPVLTFGDDGVFSSANQHDDFEAWIGKENYLKVANNMQMVETRSYENQKENIKGRISEGVVLGLFTSNEAIILHDEANAFWAATIDEDTNEKGQSVIRYFTNQVAWKKQLPEAFNTWRESFLDYPVVYGE